MATHILHAFTIIFILLKSTEIILWHIPFKAANKQQPHFIWMLFFFFKIAIVLIRYCLHYCFEKCSLYILWLNVLLAQMLVKHLNSKSNMCTTCSRSSQPNILKRLNLYRVFVFTILFLPSFPSCSFSRFNGSENPLKMLALNELFNKVFKSLRSMYKRSKCISRASIRIIWSE